MKPTGKMISLLPWLFQTQFASQARKRRLAREEVVGMDDNIVVPESSKPASEDELENQPQGKKETVLDDRHLVTVTETVVVTEHGAVNDDAPLPAGNTPEMIEEPSAADPTVALDEANLPDGGMLAANDDEVPVDSSVEAEGVKAKSVDDKGVDDKGVDNKGIADRRVVDGAKPGADDADVGSAKAASVDTPRASVETIDGEGKAESEHATSPAKKSDKEGVSAVDGASETSAQGGSRASSRKRSATERHNADLAQTFSDALNSGLFDPKWYQATYGLSFSTQREAFDDYVRKSRFAPVNPSPRFDSETYHRMYGDVFHAQQSPLHHYLRHGRGEGRHYVPATVRWYPRQIVTPGSTLTQAASELNVALCLHVFYVDFLDRFAKAIERFPVKVDVFLTLASAEFEARAQEVFGRHARVNKLETRIVPNRGRNFGPVLVEYGQALQDYDLFCHLHSKKSLYSGKEQTQWAEYLIEYLLRDTSVITRLLNAYAADESLGLYYPTTFWMMPSWVNHQTMNKGFMREWQQKLGLGHVPEFLSYPAGGMFWSRPAAMKGVLDQDWSYEDFPEEPLPNDNSMLHALERVLGPLAENLGYKQLFFYPPTGQFTTDNGYITSSYHGHLEQHIASIQAHACISFDVFDTLVRREFTVPDYAKLKLGKMLAEQGLVQSAQAFVKLRNEAESTLRRRANYQGDVRIEAIYDELADQLDVTRATAQGWMELEYELDLELIQPKDEMVELFNHLAAHGHILWVISDSYYNREQVGLMLRKAGVAAAYRLMVSSEEQARKDNGSMWVKVKQDLANEGITRHLHIGDNVVADAQMPGDLGLTTFHILHPMDKWAALGFPPVLHGADALDEMEILKWGRLINEVGRNPFIGE